MERPTIPNSGKAGKRLKGVFLLVGPPGSGKTSLSKYFIAHNLSKRKASIYVSTDEPPNSVESSLRKYRYSPRRHDLRIVDCYSWRVGISSNPSFQSVNPFNLTELAIKISMVHKGLKNFSFVLDSASALMLNAGVSETINFLQILSAQIRQAEGLGLVILEAGMHEKHVLRTLGAILDGVLQIKLEETPSGRLRRLFRAFSIKNSPHSSEWTPFEIREDRISFTTITVDEKEQTLSSPILEFPIPEDIDYEKNPIERVLNLPKRGHPILLDV